MYEQNFVQKLLQKYENSSYQKKVEKTFCKTFFFMKKRFFWKKRFFFIFFFIGRTCVFLQRIFSSDRDLPAACAAALLTWHTKVPGTHKVHGTLERAFLLESRAPRWKKCCLSSFYFSGPTWENAFSRRDAPVVGPGGTLEGTRGYLVSICRRDAPVEGRGHTSKGIQRGGAPRKGWRTPPAPPGVAHPVRGAPADHHRIRFMFSFVQNTNTNSVYD